VYWESIGLVALGAILIVLGLAIWFTAFVLVPLGAILIVVGIVKAFRTRRPTGTETPEP
jgi:membrane-bound ClpP family serine protease